MARVFVGHDWAEAHHDVFVEDEVGKRLAGARLPEGIEGVRRFHELVAEHADEPSEVTVATETDRGLFVGALVAVGYRVLAVNPLSTSRYRERLGTSGAKSDPGDALVSPTHLMVDQQLLHRRLGHHIAAIREPISELTATQGGLGHRDGQQLVQNMGRGRVRQLRPAPSLGHERLEPVALSDAAPLIERLARDPERPARRGHVAGLGRVLQHAHAPLVDDLVMGHGDGLPVLCGRNTRSITGPTQLVDLQPQPTDRKP